MVLMGEQAGRPSTPPTEPLRPRGSRSGAENDAHGRRRRPTDLQLRLDTEPEPCRTRKKTIGTSLLPDSPPPLLPARSQNPTEQPPPAPSPGRKKSASRQLSKTNAHFHKVFQGVGRDEALRQSYTCALQRDILYQGRMFLSQNWICFHSKVFGRDTKIAIPAAAVTFIKKTKTALLVPNALVIETAQEQHVFVSFLSRNATYKFLRSVCVHLEVEKTCGGHAASSCEDSFPGAIPSSLPLRRQEMTESSSSGSQTPDYDKTSDPSCQEADFSVSFSVSAFRQADFAGLPFVSASVKSGEVSVLADVHLQPGPKSKASNGSPAGEVAQAHKAWPHMSLRRILLIYLFLAGVLVASSGYMAFKMVALEHRLNSMLAAREHTHGRTNALRLQDAEIFGELSANLLKLEKIRRNLRKLLDDT